MYLINFISCPHCEMPKSENVEITNDLAIKGEEVILKCEYCEDEFNVIVKTVFATY